MSFPQQIQYKGTIPNRRSKIKGLTIAAVAVLSLFAFNIVAAEICYLEFKCDEFNQLERRIESLEALGLSVRHVFPPNAVIVNAGEIDVANASKLPGIPTQVVQESSCYDNRLEPKNVMAFSAYQHLISPPANSELKSDTAPTPLSNCLVFPEELRDSAGYSEFEGFRTVDGDMFTSLYMYGRVAVKIILIESIGQDENWYPEAESNTVDEIVEGLDFLSQGAEEHGARLSWVYDVSFQVPTSFEPIQEDHVPKYEATPDPHWEFKWINHAIQALGYSRDKWDGLFDIANDMRQTYHANWGFSVFVVMDENDADHMFADEKFAFVPLYADYFNAPWNGCTVIMTYNNDNWSPTNMNRVLRHEVGHIFRAPDEYYREETDTGCEENDCTTAYGYLWEDNGNCVRCNPNSVPCSMRANESALCQYSISHFGWRDNDLDGVPDAKKLNEGGWEPLFGVVPGDLVRIYTPDFDLVNVISVTSDNIIDDHVIWDGMNYDGQAVVQGGLYIYTVNGGSETAFTLNPSDPSVKPLIQNLSYADGRIEFELKTSWACLRCFIHDASDEYSHEAPMGRASRSKHHYNYRFIPIARRH